jgi:hypothetical protein
MSDFPTALVTPNGFTICPTSDILQPVGQWALFSNNLAGTAVWPVANTAIYTVFNLEIPMVLRTMGIKVNVQSGNLDVGVYDEKGNSIVTKGSTAVAAAGFQSIDMTASISHGSASPILMPGTYWAAMNCDNVTASFGRISPGVNTTRFGALQQQAVGAVALPTTATFANIASSYSPLLVLSSETVL